MGEAKKVCYQKDHYYLYEEIVSLLKAWEEAYPQLVELSTIGTSFEGRDILSITLTDKNTGCASEKPAFYIDANHHAGEVTGSAVALYTIDYLLRNFGKCDRVTRLLTDKTFYIVPRIAVDGSELYLTTPYLLRSSVREYSPHLQEGMVMEDIDNDGRILQMRVKNANGKYKICDKDPRLMIPRSPDDWDGEYYDVYYEGIIEDYDGFEVKPFRSKWSLDFNRNYPTNWHPEIRQKGAGPYPFSEPETRAIGDFLLEHTNIAGAMSYHTSGGIILRPRCAGGDKTMDKQDIEVFKELGVIGEEITGYPCWSIFEKFTVNKDRPSAGSFIDYSYDQLGLITFATELWDMRGRAGLEKIDLPKRLNQTAKEIEADGLKLLKWNDEQLEGELFVNWYEAEHPQLGTVELGGWKPKFGRQNPPTQLLEEECHKNMMFTLSHADSLPLLRVQDSCVQAVGEDLYKVQVEFANAGALPTSGSKQAEKVKAVEEVTAEIKGEGQVVVGKNEQKFGHLAGFSKKRVQWLVKGAVRTELEVVLTSERAGVSCHKVILK